jgi:ActR/RegA family two-component response regulator
MAMPFDTLRLARRLEAAGFAPQQAGDMAEAIAEAVAQLATKADLTALEMRIDSKLEILKRDMTIRLGGMMVVSVGVILAGFKLIH